MEELWKEIDEVMDDVSKNKLVSPENIAKITEVLQKHEVAIVPMPVIDSEDMTSLIHNLLGRMAHIREAGKPPEERKKKRAGFLIPGPDTIQ